MATRRIPGDETTIDRLVAALTPVRPRTVARDALWLAAVAVVELVVVLMFRAPRTDMMTAMAGL